MTHIKHQQRKVKHLKIIQTKINAAHTKQKLKKEQKFVSKFKLLFKKEMEINQDNAKNSLGRIISAAKIYRNVYRII
jgi:hypothetical protein